MKIESKIGNINSNGETVFHFISNFNNFKNLVPADKVSNWESSESECTFDVNGLGKTGMRIIEQEPHKLVKVEAIESSPFNFNLWIQLREITDMETKVKITIEPHVNPMMQMMVKTPLKNFVDALVEKMSTYNFETS